MTSSIDPGAPRFARQRILPGLGTEGQRRLAAAHVVVLGAGGLGSAVVPPLVAAGVGRLTIVDDDRVDETNLHRQLLHTARDVGRAKVASAADAAAALSPDTEVVAVDARFDDGTADDLLAGADLVVDGTDDVATRYVADDAAGRAGIPLVWGSALRFSGQAGVTWPARGVSYRDLFPDPPATGGSCEIEGILPTVCTVTGGLMATEVLKLLTGLGEPLVGRVAAYDALTGRVREIAYRAPGPERPSSRRSAVPERAKRDEGPRSATGTGIPSRPATEAGTSGRSTPSPNGRTPMVTEITAPDLAAELDGDAPPVLLDVREPWEVELAAIPGAVSIPLAQVADRIGELDPAASVVVYCHHGVRSERAAQHLAASGFTQVRNLAGGIDAWSTQVDPEVKRY